MKSVGVAELKAHLSRYLSSVKEGEAVMVTDRGRAVARLVPVDPGAGRELASRSSLAWAWLGFRAKDIRDLAAPSHRLHPLKGPKKGRWAVDVDRTWRITFAFDGRDCSDVDYEDYH